MIDFEDISKFTGKSEECIRNVYKDLFVQIKNNITREALPTVHLQGFGKFYVKKSKIDGIIRGYIKQLREGSHSEEEVNNIKSRIRSLWKAREGRYYNKRL